MNFEQSDVAAPVSAASRRVGPVKESGASGPATLLMSTDMTKFHTSGRREDRRIMAAHGYRLFGVRNTDCKSKPLKRKFTREQEFAAKKQMRKERLRAVSAARAAAKKCHAGNEFVPQQAAAMASSAPERNAHGRSDSTEPAMDMECGAGAGSNTGVGD